MEEQNNWASGFEFVDIEIIDHHRQPEVLNPQKWSCDHCNLFYLSYENLMEHKKKHMNNSQVKCRYCNKVLSVTEESRECYANGKCETCEYRCSQCPKRFLRHSSLMNHENNHSQPKKNKRPHPRSANIEVPKLESTQKTVNKKILKTVDSEALCSNSAPVETDIPTKGKRKPSSSPKKRTRLQSQKPMIESNINDGDIDINNSRVSKRSSLILLKDNHNLKSSKQTKEKFIKTSDTAITKNQVGVSTPTAQTGTSSSEVNSVNYKPFSCHVCNDNFASENILLEHIKSHGDAAKHFKCRFCPEAFDTIYDIQYHLAVCPLAEDELESTLMNSTPPKLVITSPRSLNKPLTKGKRGRPKKFRDSLPNSKEEMVTSDIAKSDSAPLVRTRNKRKSLEKPVEPSNKILKVSSSSVPDTTVKNRSVEREVKFDDPQSNLSETDVTGDDYQSPNNDSFVTSVKNQEKHHSCPFPRCDRKFTREKALECHMRNHNDDLDETLQCYKCDIPFDDVKSLRMHVDECQGLREEKDDDFSGPKQNKTERQDANKTGPHKFGDDFLCKTCGRTYQSKEKLKRHMAEHSSSNFVCRVCKDVFPNQSILDQHFLDSHPTMTSHHCDTCNEDFISELFLQIHQTEYHTTSTTPIIIKPSSKSLVQMRNSLRKKSTDLKQFNKSGYLQNKITNALAKKDDNLFFCPVCFETFSKRENLRSHFHSSHSFVSGSVYVCELCDIEKPSAELLCWHLEVHSYNALSVNRFSKLRTHASSIRKEDTELFKQLPKSTLQTDLKTDGFSERKTNFWKENTMQKFITSKLKLSLCKKEKNVQSQAKSKLLGRSKLNLQSSKISLLQGSNTTTSSVMKADEKFVGNKIRKIRSGSVSKVIAKTANDKSLNKLEDCVGKCIERKNKRRFKIKTKNGDIKKHLTKHENLDIDSFKSNGRSKEPCDESDVILDKLLGGSNNSLEVESTNNGPVNQTCEKEIDQDTKSGITKNKANDDFRSSFEAGTVESPVNSPEVERESLSSDLMRKSALETSVDTLTPVAAKSILSKKGKSRFKNLRISCPTKRKKGYVINTHKFNKPQMTLKGTNINCDNQESNNKTTTDADSNLTEDKSSLVAVVDNKTLNPLSKKNTDTHSQPNNMEESFKWEMKTKSKPTYNKDEQISANKQLELHDSLKNENECENLASNITECFKFEVPIIITKKNSPNKKVSSKVLTEDMKKKTLAMCGKSIKDSSVPFENEESSKEDSNASTNLESNSPEANASCGANDVFSQTSSTKLDSEEILAENFVRECGKSNTSEDQQGTAIGKHVLGKCEENSQPVSANSLEEQKDKPDGSGSSTLLGVETEITQSQLKASEDVHHTEDLKNNEANDLFEEVSCDKCSLKFYNQDDLFDHIGSHYDI